MNYEEKLTSVQKEKIMKLEQATEEGKGIKGEDVISLLDEIFNPTGIYEETYVPTSFLVSKLGNSLLGSLYKSDYNEELTVADVCKELDVSKQYINKCLKNKKIEGTLKGGVWWIRRSELERFKATKK